MKIEWKGKKPGAALYGQALESQGGQWWTKVKERGWQRNNQWHKIGERKNWRPQATLPQTDLTSSLTTHVCEVQVLKFWAETAWAKGYGFWLAVKHWWKPKHSSFRPRNKNKSQSHNLQNLIRTEVPLHQSFKPRNSILHKKTSFVSSPNKNRKNGMMGKQTRNSQKVTSPRKTDQIAMIVIEHTRAPKWTKSFYTHKFRDREEIPSRKVTRYMKIGTSFPSTTHPIQPVSDSGPSLERKNSKAARLLKETNFSSRDTRYWKWREEKNYSSKIQLPARQFNSRVYKGPTFLQQRSDPTGQ